MKSIARCAVAAAASLLVTVWHLPAEAAPASTDTTADTITFDQYRDWRMHFIDERQTQIAAQLAEKKPHRRAPRRARTAEGLL